MANYCNNDIVVFAYEKDKVEEFRKFMEDYIQNNEDKTVRGFVLRCGFPKEEAYKITDHRDTLIDIDDQIYKKEDVYYFNFQTESAWTPNVEVFKSIIQAKFNGELEIEYRSEEPGVGNYINTDEEGFFFSERFFLDSCVNDEYHTEYYDSKEEVLEWVKEKFPEADVSINNEVYEIENIVQKYIDDTGDDFFSLYEFANW